MHDLLKIRRALFCCFFVLGFAMASWIVRTPAIRDVLDASTGQMGLILFGFSAGSMIGILAAARIVAMAGVGRSITGGLVTVLAGLSCMALATVAGSAWLAGLGLALVGFGMAVGEVAVNMLGAQVEQGLARPVLTLVHGCYSLGTVAGAACGLFIIGQGVPVHWHLLIACALLAPAVAYVSLGVRGGPVDGGENGAPHAGFIATVRADPRLLLVGAIVLAVALAEGAANDWLPLLIVEAHQVPEQYASLAFVAFAATMTAGRFAGTGVLRRAGPAAVMRASGCIGALGILLLVLAPSLPVAIAAVVLWGIGASLGFPVAMSAGAASGPDTNARVAVLATIGYCAFLVGPPLLGFLGEQVGLRMSMLVVLALLCIPIMLAPCLKPRAGDHLIAVEPQGAATGSER